MTFPRDVLDLWDQTDEIDVETSRGGADARVHRTTIWIVVDGDEAFIRSVRGPAGRWYRELTANPRGAIHAGDQRVAVRASAAVDPATVARVSAAISKKYHSRWPGPTAAMLQPDTLPTTLRLKPA
jgi:hypothetical protein